MAVLQLQKHVAAFPRFAVARAQPRSKEIPVMHADPAVHANDDDQAHVVHLWRPARAQKLRVNEVVLVQTSRVHRASSPQHAANGLGEELAVFKTIDGIKVRNFFGQDGAAVATARLHGHGMHVEQDAHVQPEAAVRLACQCLQKKHVSASSIDRQRNTARHERTVFMSCSRESPAKLGSMASDKNGAK